jgi:MoxR-like ATPase
MRLTAEEREALRSALRKHPNRPQDMQVSALKKEELLRACETLGIDTAETIRAATAPQGAMALSVTSTNTGADLDDSGDVDDPVELEPVSDPVEDAIKPILAPLGQGDFGTFKNRLRELAQKALVKPEPAQTSAMPVLVIPTSAGAHEASKIFPELKNTFAARVMLNVTENGNTRPVDPNYVFPASLDMIVSTLYRRGGNVFLTGPKGAGKTSLAEQIAARLKAPFAHIECSEATDGPYLIGQTLPTPDGGTAWRDGVLAAAIRKPGTVVLIDEPSTARPGALMALQGVLSALRTLTIPETGEAVRVAPGVVFILADNTNGSGDTTGAYAGTAPMNSATVDRAAIMVRVDYADRDTEAKIISAKTGCTPTLAQIIADCALATRQDADKGKLTMGLGLRRLLALGELLADGADPERAVETSILAHCPPDDREHLRQMTVAMLAPAAIKAARDGRAETGKTRAKKAADADALENF